MSRLRTAALWIAAAAGIVMFGGCEPATSAQAKADRPFEGARVVHDDDRNVTCWVLSGYQERGISCLPDWMLTKHQGIPLQGGGQ